MYGRDDCVMHIVPFCLQKLIEVMRMSKMLDQARKYEKEEE